mmetsp:Transcript_116715/g.337116  ORF Transcript_116715/g.337116 Transcript_116715/m.337116 type:complete len:107 (+) Transcript_116715:89-409(+)
MFSVVSISAQSSATQFPVKVFSLRLDDVDLLSNWLFWLDLGDLEEKNAILKFGRDILAINSVLADGEASGKRNRLGFLFAAHVSGSADLQNSFFEKNFNVILRNTG